MGKKKDLLKIIYFYTYLKVAVESGRNCEEREQGMTCSKCARAARNKKLHP